MPLTRRRSLRKQLRARGQPWHLWRAQEGLDTSPEDCDAFLETNEPLINYLDVSRGAQSGFRLSPKASQNPHDSRKCPACPGSLPAWCFFPGNVRMRTREGIHCQPCCALPTPLERHLLQNSSYMLFGAEPTTEQLETFPKRISFPSSPVPKGPAW